MTLVKFGLGLDLALLVIAAIAGFTGATGAAIGLIALYLTGNAVENFKKAI